MGDTHHRSNLREHSAGLVVAYTTGSFVDCNVGTITGTGVVAGANVRGTSYFRLGTDVYIVSGVPAAFTNAGVSLAATSGSGITEAGLGEGTIFLSASLNHPASACFVKVAPATWCNVTTGNDLSG
jgi:hypothetical protein